MKCVASFPSTYHEIHDMLLTWVTPQGKWLTRWHRHCLQEWNAEEQSIELCSCQPTTKNQQSTYLDYSRGSCHAGVRRGVVDTPPHLNPCGGNHIKSAWPLINKESHCYFHMHVFACADYVTDDTHIVASHCTLQLRDTTPQLKLLWFIGWYIIHHPCSCN